MEKKIVIREPNMNEMDSSVQSRLSLKEEMELINRIKDGVTALNELRESNLRVVTSVAMEYQDKGLTLEELIEEGNKGLYEAAKRFDENKGFKFISYAVWFIKKSIERALDNN